MENIDIRYLREKARLRAVDVANLVGVGESSMRNWKKGRIEPRFTYRCSLDELDKASKSFSQAIQ